MADKDLRIFISAAEPSGDLYGSLLIREMRALCPGAQFVGIAGPAMQRAGCRSVYDLTTDSAMLMGVLGSLRSGFAAISASTNELSSLRFDAAVLIDSPVLHLPLAKRIKRRGVPVLYYVPPQLWAWGESRLRKLRARADRVAVILPFEEDYFRQRQVNATYVGHPLFDALADRPVDDSLVQQIRDRGRPRIAILPGSRGHVVGEVLPGQLEVAAAIRRAFPDAFVGVSVAGDSVKRLIQSLVERCVFPVTMFHQQNGELLTAADLTLVASGTATLEVAYYGSPMIVMYNSSWLMYHLLARWMVRLKHYSLMNILAGREIVPEFMPYYRSTTPIAAKAIELLSSPERLEAVRREIATLIEPLRCAGASRRTGELLLDMIGRDN